MSTHTPSSMMDPSFKPSSASMDSTDLFEQMYQNMTPGLMTPLDDWSQSDLLSDFINIASGGNGGDVLVVPPQQQSLVQDTFLTSPCSTKDYLWASAPPQDLFNALSTPSISPVVTVPDVVNECDDHFGGLIDSLVVPGSPSLDLLAVPAPSSACGGGGGDAPVSPLSPLTDVSSGSTTPLSTISQPVSPPLEMIMKLDPVPTKHIKKDTNTLKRKATAPAAAQPVACHITSASTPTFVLKQHSRKRPLSSTSSAQDLMATSSSTATGSSSTSQNGVSSELALKRQKNTDAARRSRLKKLQKMETMATRVSEMESMHHRLLSRVSALESDKSLLLQKETDYLSRIQQLEADLSLAQQKLGYSL
ncbi:hypothetical protein BCR42DRAFT_15724 [Absidia repens]|uniref:BZIP domain-containing protein n=1 Tax=Absidia repens TaxID=90262 RepID=A0A1X2J1X5_9FUNG|nr:hypothetical protein BCR42DRAFT_15724 [Absidia repens]